MTNQGIGVHIDAVYQVLLADGWHHVEMASFRVGYQYKFFVPGAPVVRVGSDSGDRVESYAFAFIDLEGVHYYGPLTSVLAVQFDPGGV